MFSNILILLVMTFVAGIIGAAIVAVLRLLERKIFKTEATLIYAQIASKLFRLDFEMMPPERKTKINYISEYIYGGLLGIPMLILVMTLKSTWQLFLLSYFVLVWIVEMAILYFTKIVPPFWQWPKRDIAISLVMKLVYASIAMFAFVQILSIVIALQ
jgi:hypothetical protein